MDDSFEEISNKINNGIPLSEEEQQSLNRLNDKTQKFIEALKSKGLLPLQPIGEKMALLSQKLGEVAPALIESHKKGLAAINTAMDWDGFGKAVIRFQELYNEKKRLWNKKRNYYKNRGFDYDFEEVMHDLTRFFPHLKKKRIAELFGMPNDEFRELFDDWFVACEAESDRGIEEARIRRIAQAPPAPTSTEPKKHAKTIQKEQNYVTYTNKYIDLRKKVSPIYNREGAIKKVLDEFIIDERTLGRAFDANADTLEKFGHEKKIFKKYSRVKWS
ncbi:hypothetical protein GVN20_25775 [Runella sp. CRIBMP]|uniref:hypothetical protein n=1 Tax=Runella sp. CRIBMP TaxID=2683261 RepID=UPI001411FC4C|nr:hypothetical protein [Runella sp. CRIBMP]NBB22791.1 hypothetical protein [Runella sp. CRIBMP]